MNTLLPHQVGAIDWLGKHARGGLWDEQGLGKTISAIMAAKHFETVLVIVPTAVAFNWQREFKIWDPRRRVQVVLAAHENFSPLADVVITTHGMLLKKRIVDQMIEFDAVILDEGHFMRNATAKRSAAFYLGKEAVCRRAPHSWVLTGTPMANHPGELWTTLAGMAPDRLKLDGKLMSLGAFKRRFCVMIPDSHGKMKVVGVKNAPELRERLKGFALRRLKADVLKDLPEKRWGTVALNPMESVRDPEGIDTLEDMQSYENFAEWRHACGLAKVAPALDVLESDLESGMEKVVIFAHHLDVIEKLRVGLAAFNPVVLTGSVSPRDRQHLVDRFQTDKQTRVCIAQIQAGGVGITLTAASDCVFVEMSFVPGDNAQAVDRLHRIGQKNSVLARFFSLAGSVDEIIVEALSRKTQMIRTVLSE